MWARLCWSLGDRNRPPTPKKKSHAKQTSSVVRRTPDFGGQVAPSPPLATSAKDATAQRKEGIQNPREICRFPAAVLQRPSSSFVVAAECKPYAKRASPSDVSPLDLRESASISGCFVFLRREAATYLSIATHRLAAELRFGSTISGTGANGKSWAPGREIKAARQPAHIAPATSQP